MYEEHPHIVLWVALAKKAYPCPALTDHTNGVYINEQIRHVCMHHNVLASFILLSPAGPRHPSFMPQILACESTKAAEALQAEYVGTYLHHTCHAIASCKAGKMHVGCTVFQ